MGNMCCDLFKSNPEDSLPNFIAYKKNDLSTVNYARFSSDQSIVDDDRSEDNSSNQPFPTIENYIVIWLTSDISEDEHLFAQLRRIVHSFRIFITIEEFCTFLDQMKDEKLCVILSKSFTRHILPLIQKVSQLIAIYVISDDQPKEQQWMNQYEKIKGLFCSIEPICERLKRILHLPEGDIQPTEVLNSSAVVSQYLIRQILLEEIDYSEKLKGNLIDFVQRQYPQEMEVIKEFEENYTPSAAVWWYSRKCFLSSVMSEAFRTQNLEFLLKIGFFIRDLHQHVHQHSNPTVVYCGQGISEEQFETIKRDAFLSFKNFLWTNTNRTHSLNAARLARNNPDLLGVLFCIEINSRVELISFDQIRSYSTGENEYLFSIYSLFRIERIQEIEEQIWRIDLIFIENKHQQVRDFLQPIESTHEQTSWQRLGLYFMQIHQSDKAEELYRILLDFNLISHPKQLAFLHEQLAILYHHKNDCIRSLIFYKKSLKAYQTILSSDDLYLIQIHLNIGLLFHQQKNFYDAMKYFKYALNIALHSSPLDRLQISILYHHIADIYDDEEAFVEAIQNYQSALEHELKRVPIDHSSIAKTYNKIGEIFYRMDDYTRAFSYFDKTLQIQKKSLSPNHSILANTNYNLALVLNGLHQYKEAIEYASRAVNIARHSFGSDHQDVQLYEEYLEKLRKKTCVGVIPNGAVYG